MAVKYIPVKWKMNDKADGYLVFEKLGNNHRFLVHIHEKDRCEIEIPTTNKYVVRQFEIYSRSEETDKYIGKQILNIVDREPYGWGFTILSRTENTISFSWKKYGIADCYILEKFIDNEWVWIATIDGDQNSYRISGLNPGVVYKFRLMVETEENGIIAFSPFSKILTVETLPKAVKNMERHK